MDTVQNTEKLDAELIKKESYNNWLKDGNRNNEILYDFPMLYPKATIFDLGGYKGEWAHKIWSKYRGRFFIYEPIFAYANYINALFGIDYMYHDDIDITIVSAAASNKTGSATLDIKGAGSSLHTGNTGLPINTIDISESIVKNEIESIDLMKINIEGEEYNVIDSLVASGKIKDISQLLIQPHTFVEDPVSKYDFMHQQLSLTHERVWSYAFIWELWRKK